MISWTLPNNTNASPTGRIIIFAYSPIGTYYCFYSGTVCLNEGVGEGID